MKMKNSLALLFITLTLIFVLVFYSYPLMGHDYRMFLPTLSDYHYAWENFSVFFIQFSPQRCNGIPVWANPVGTLFSITHFLALFFNDITVLVAYITLIISVSFWGTLKFQETLKTKKYFRNYFSFAWCLQGYIVARAIVGHVPFIAIGLWPLYCHFLLQNPKNKKQFLFQVTIFSILYAHDFYSGNTYLCAMFPLAFAFLIFILWYNDFEINFKQSFKKFLFGIILASLIVLPKVLAVISFSQNFQRNTPFVNVGILKGLEYTVMSLFFPIPLNYAQMTSWPYGNWESINFMFPGFFIFMFATSLMKMNENKKILLSLFGLIIVGAFISSGIYAGIISQIPIVKSFHVNPRWMPIISLALFALAIAYCNKTNIPKWTRYALLTLVILPPIFTRDNRDLFVIYRYHDGYYPLENRLAYCYEPVFGYGLELMPRKFTPEGRYLDPRCYLGKHKCTDYLLPKNLNRDLEMYKLEKFNN